MKKMARNVLAASLAVALAGGAPVHADDKGDLLLLKKTTLNLIDALVQQGVLSREQADRLIRNAETAAQAEVRASEQKATQGDKRVVRVPYVPEFVRDEIKQQVETDMRAKVVDDVMAQAKKERWGVPDALPAWISRIKLNGDIRLRGEGIFYSSSNPENAFIDYQKSNDDGTPEVLNSTEDRKRARLRLRLGMEAAINDNVKAGVRIATGSLNNPVSTNQTLGNAFQPDQLVLDRAYLQYRALDSEHFNWLTLTGGRMPNPWFSTDLEWDGDLNFDGVAATAKYGFGHGSADSERSLLFATAGAFPLQEVALSSRDKWLFGAQIGFNKAFADKSSFKLGVAYYDYTNTTGKQNTLDSTLEDFTAPEFVQKGNSMFLISNDSSGAARRFGLAADYNILDVTARFDLARFAPVHWTLSGTYVKNIGYNAGDIRRRTGGQMFVNSTDSAEDPSREKTTGYLGKLSLGWPAADKRNRWRASASYRYLERDAVVDAYTDSDFHLGGTNNKGWIMGGDYGLADNVWLTMRYLSADEIDGPALGIDLLQLDLNAKF